MPAFEGFDHIDCRVRSLAAVEAFYDALMPELGLSVRRFHHVDDAGEWHAVSPERPRNVIEYYEPAQAGRPPFFMGIIERADHVVSDTRIAFRTSHARMLELEARLAAMGALRIERSEDWEAYAAVFFEDPVGTKLELTAPKPGT